MRIAIAGGHGQIALIIQELLAQAGHQGIGLIRKPEQGGDLEAVGGLPLVVDLEAVDAATLADHLHGVDALVFAAGAGPNSGPERKLTVDRDGAILLADAAELAGIGRYVMISALSADSYEPDSDEVFQIYLRAKSEADADLRGRDLDWIVIRPGSLTNDPSTGLVTIGNTGRGSVPRVDVAAVVVAALLDDNLARKQFDLISGETPITEALASLSD